jgi:protein gp37
MNYTDIEWTRGADGRKGLTWNPIKGICPVGCWYCYARGIYKRFKLDPAPRLDESELMTPLHWADEGKRIFVCSTFELFHPVADEWRDDIFEVIERRYDMTFIILTKMPERIDRPMPDNVWLGVSVTGGNQAAIDRLVPLYGSTARVKFVSIEPLLERPNDTLLEFITRPRWIQWVIVGRLTGHGKKSDPNLRWLGKIRIATRKAGIPLFLKNNLASIWGKPLIQEWPK